MFTVRAAAGTAVAALSLEVVATPGEAEMGPGTRAPGAASGAAPVPLQRGRLVQVIETIHAMNPG